MTAFIHHDGALGDVLLSLPAIRAIVKSAGPVHLSAGSDIGGLLKFTGFVGKVSTTCSALFSSLYAESVDTKTRAFLSGFDRAFVFTTLRDSVMVKKIRALLPDTEAILTIPPGGNRMPAGAFRLAQVLEVSVRDTMKGKDDDALSPVLKIPPVFREAVREFLARSGYDYKRPLISVHPGSGGTRKCWPIGNYFHLIEKVKKDCNAFFVVFSGPAEEGRMKAMITDFAEKTTEVIHICDEELTKVAAIVGLSAVYLGNDSGITHLASVLDRDGIAIFGPTDPLIWRPSGDRIRVVSSEAECAPCGDAQSRICKQQTCLSTISVERVYEELMGVIDDSMHG